MLNKNFFYKICLTFTEKSDKQDPPTSLGCGMNCKIRVTSAVAERIASPTDMRLIPAGRNIGIQPPHKGYRLGIKTMEGGVFYKNMKCNSDFVNNFGVKSGVLIACKNSILIK